jgi:hypothetical protein
MSLPEMVDSSRPDHAPGDYGVVQAARFAKVYRLAD